MANLPSDHSSAENAPGSSAPAQQGPLQAGNLDAPGVFNPDNNLPLPLPGLPATDLSAPIRQPRTLTQGQPPLARGWGVDNVLNLAQARQLPHDFGTSTGQAAAGQQANLVPLVAFPVLSRLGPQAVSWAVPVTIASLSVVTARMSYKDLKITPGIRGIQLAYGATGGPVSIRNNITGMTYQLPDGPVTAFLPLFMLREFCDVTISCSSGIFPANATCLLTTEEQLPFLIEDVSNVGSVPLQNSATGSTGGISASLTSQAGRTVFVTGLQILAAGATAAGSANATLSGIVGGAMNITVAWPVLGGAMSPITMTFNPPLPCAIGNNAILSFGGQGAGGVTESVSMQGYLV
jgi:hypothetical protein